MQKIHLYRVSLNLERGQENSHLLSIVFLLINTFLLVFVNIFLQFEVSPCTGASFVFLSSGFGEFETGLFRNLPLHNCTRRCIPVTGPISHSGKSRILWRRGHYQESDLDKYHLLQYLCTSK